MATSDMDELTNKWIQCLVCTHHEEEDTWLIDWFLRGCKLDEADEKGNNKTGITN